MYLSNAIWYSGPMKRPQTVVAAHVVDRNRALWIEFLKAAESLGLSNSVALERAAAHWLLALGRPVLMDPAPVPTVRIKPLCKCHGPVEVERDLAPYFDRYVCPPHIIAED